MVVITHHRQTCKRYPAPSRQALSHTCIRALPSQGQPTSAPVKRLQALPSSVNASPLLHQC